MGVKPGPDRIFNYKVKHDPEHIKQLHMLRRDQMLAKQTEKQEALVELETRAKEVLGTTGVPTYSYVAYLNFCREVWKKKNRFSGESLARETRAIMAKWIARELREDVLIKLRREVLTIPEATTQESSQ